MSDTISKLYMEASRRYRTSSYTCAVSGVIVGALLVFSLLTLDHTTVNMVSRGVLFILVLVNFAGAAWYTKKADQNKALAEKWRNW